MKIHCIARADQTDGVVSLEIVEVFVKEDSAQKVAETLTRTSGEEHFVCPLEVNTLFGRPVFDAPQCIHIQGCSCGAGEVQ